MSSITWTPTELESNSVPASLTIWRCIPKDSDRAISKLVDSAVDAQILAQMLEEVGPSALPGQEMYSDLISGPFRYGPKSKSGTRFRAVGDPGVFYGALDVETALKEQSWWRAKFLASSEELKDAKGMSLQVFSVDVADSAINLMNPPLNRDHDKWTRDLDYEDTQELARRSRAADLGGIQYSSVRNFPNGVCFVVLRLGAIQSLQPNFYDGNWWLSFSGNHATVIQDPLVGNNGAFSFDFAT